MGCNEPQVVDALRILLTTAAQDGKARRAAEIKKIKVRGLGLRAIARALRMPPSSVHKALSLRTSGHLERLIRGGQHHAVVIGHQTEALARLRPKR